MINVIFMLCFIFTGKLSFPPSNLSHFAILKRIETKMKHFRMLSVNSAFYLVSMSITYDPVKANCYVIKVDDKKGF